MPGAAAAAVVGFFAVTGAAATVISGLTYIVVTGLLNYGLNRLASSLAGKPKRYTTSAARDITVRGTVEPMQMIYGEVLTPGFIANYATSGTNNRYLHFVVVVAAHQCEDITDVYLDSRYIPDADIDGSGDVSAAEFQGEGASRLNIKRYLGTKAQTADSELSGSSIGNWSSSHRGAGIAWMHIRLDGSDSVWAAGSPANFRALVKGRRLYDPSKDSTNGGSGSHRADNATTWEWSQNAALAIRDYISGGSRWYDNATPEPRLGFGEDSDHIDDSYTIAARSICNESVLVPPVASPSRHQSRYTCDVQLSCGDTYRENLEILKSACVGNVTYVNGKYRIYAGAYDTPEVELEEDDILGPVTVSTHPNGEDLYNLVRGTFFDETRDWQLASFPNITNSSYETDDGGQFPRDIELHATRTSYRAQRIAILHLAQSRNKITVRFDRLSPKAMAIAQHETFMVTISEYGWSQKVFRCLEWEFMPDGFIAITAREESSAAYADPSIGTYATGSEGTVATPEFDEPDTPINFEAVSMPEGILFLWDAQEPSNQDTLFRLYEYTSQTPFSSATEIWSGKSRSVMIQRSGYDIRYYWLTAVLNGMESEETPSGNGLAASPSLRGFEEKFGDSFEHQDFDRFYDLIAGTPTITFPANGETGGRVLRVEDYGRFAWKKNIAYDPDSLYLLTIRARMVTAPSNPAKDLFYASVIGVAADGTTLIDRTGADSFTAQIDIAASGNDFGSVSPIGTWVTFRGYFSGLGTPDSAAHPDIEDPQVMYRSGGTVTKFFRPLIILNYDGGDGIMEVDEVRVDKVIYTSRIGPNAATETYVSTAKVGGSVTVTSSSTPVSLTFNGETRTSVLNIIPEIDCTVEVSLSAIITLTSVSSGVPELWYSIQGPSSQGEYGSVRGISGQTIETQFAAIANIDLAAGVDSDITAKWAKGFGLSAQGVSVNSEVLRVTVIKK